MCIQDPPLKGSQNTEVQFTIYPSICFILHQPLGTGFGIVCVCVTHIYVINVYN